VKRFLAVIFVLFLGFVLINRQRLFVNDLIAKVERNGVRVEGARVYINYANDVLVEEPGAPYRYLVQGWNRRPGAPRYLHCLRWMGCMTDGDRADTVPLGGTNYRPNVQMSNREVSFTDPEGAAVRIRLR
jgi:hypothetical protein